MARIYPYGRVELKQRYQQFLSVGFFISIFFHLLLLIIFFIFYRPENIKPESVVTIRIVVPEVVTSQEQEIIEKLPKMFLKQRKADKLEDGIGEEIIAVNDNNRPGNTTNNLDPNSGPSRRTSVGIPDSRNIPRKGAGMDDKSYSFPDSKIDINDKKTDGKFGTPVPGKKDEFSMNGGKETKNIRIPGNKDGIDGMARSNSPGSKNIPGKDGSGIVGGSASNYTVSWNDGGSRTKLSGALPKNPETLSKAVQIKIAITVSPEGIVTKAAPLQKGDSKLENEAIKTIRGWKFEKLKANVPQKEQSAVITFKFTLE